MVKKTYTTPATLMLIVASKGILAASDPKVTMDSTDDVDAANIGVKGQSTHSYNVWDDDWSK